MLPEKAHHRVRQHHAGGREPQRIFRQELRDAEADGEHAHRMYPNAMNGGRLPSLSLAVPMRNVQKVDTTAETPTIHATMDGSGAIFRYTKVLNQEFSMFQQICPAIPSAQMSAQFLRDIFSMRLPRFPQTARPQAAAAQNIFHSACIVSWGAAL